MRYQIQNYKQVQSSLFIIGIPQLLNANVKITGLRLRKKTLHSFKILIILYYSTRNDCNPGTRNICPGNSAVASLLLLLHKYLSKLLTNGHAYH